MWYIYIFAYIILDRACNLLSLILFTYLFYNFNEIFQATEKQRKNVANTTHLLGLSNLDAIGAKGNFFQFSEQLTHLYVPKKYGGC